MVARSDPSLESFSRVVEAIYDCAVNPERWGEALRLIGELTDSPCLGAGLIDYAQERLVHSWWHGFDRGYPRLYQDKFPVNPLMKRSHQKPLGEVYTFAMLGNAAEIQRSPLHLEWGQPQGLLGDFIGINALRSGRRVASLNAQRKERQPDYGEHGIQLFRLLAPHIRRAFAVSDALDLRTLTSQVLQATLDALAAGVYLTDREGRLVYMNRAAEHQIKTGNALRIVNSRLAPVSFNAHGALRTAIAVAISDEAATPTSGIALALPDGDKAGLVATILPLDRGLRHTVSRPFAAAVAVFVQDPLIVPPYPGEAFAKLHGLTGAELRVLLAMAPGLGVRDAAAMLGIGEVTARTHLQHIYAKTGTSKQTELLNLLKNSTPPVKGA